MKLIAVTTLILLVFSCTNVTRPSYVELNPDIRITNSNIGNSKKIRLNFAKIDPTISYFKENQLGYKVRETLLYSKTSTGIFSNNRLIDVLENNFTNWFKTNGFKITKENSFDKEIDIKLGYYSFQPISFIKLPKTRFAIKITVLDSKKQKIFSKWYFYEKNHDNFIGNNDENEIHINNSIKYLIEEIFKDDNFIYKI